MEVIASERRVGYSVESTLKTAIGVTRDGWTEWLWDGPDGLAVLDCRGEAWFGRRGTQRVLDQKTREMGSSTFYSGQVAYNPIF